MLLSCYNKHEFKLEYLTAGHVSEIDLGEL